MRAIAALKIQIYGSSDAGESCTTVRLVEGYELDGGLGVGGHTSLSCLLALENI